MTPRSSQAVDAGTRAVHEPVQAQNRLAETEKNQPRAPEPSRDAPVCKGGILDLGDGHRCAVIHSRRVTPMKPCRTTGKVRFATHRAAIAALSDCIRQSLGGRVYRMERDIYLCNHCDCWHLTSSRRAS
jgi:hypothetical protein